MVDESEESQEEIIDAVMKEFNTALEVEATEWEAAALESFQEEEPDDPER